MATIAIDWLNVPLEDVRRIDVLILAGGLVCVGYYGLFYGWRGALIGGVTYAVLGALTPLMRALW